MSALPTPYADVVAATDDTIDPAVTVTAVAWHTIDHQVAFDIGETYDVPSKLLLSTVVGCGFVSMPTPTEPPPEPVAATGATAGTPGSFTPSGATAPADLAAMTAIVASPVTAWTTGQSVTLGDTSSCYWDGVTWIVGTAP